MHDALEALNTACATKVQEARLENDDEVGYVVSLRAGAVIHHEQYNRYHYKHCFIMALRSLSCN